MATDIIRTPEEAKRFARVVLSDILVYNGPKIEKGLMEDNLFESLRDELYEGELYYRSRVEKGLCDSTNFFNLAMVDMLIKPKGGLKTPLW